MWKHSSHIGFMWKCWSAGHQYSATDWVHQCSPNKPQSRNHQCRDPLQGMSQKFSHCAVAAETSLCVFVQCWYVSLCSQLMEHTIAGIEDLCGQWSRHYWKDKWDKALMSLVPVSVLDNAIVLCVCVGVVTASQTRVVFSFREQQRVCQNSLNLHFFFGICFFFFAFLLRNIS